MATLAHRHGFYRHAHEFTPRHRHLLLPWRASVAGRPRGDCGSQLKPADDISTDQACVAAVCAAGSQPRANVGGHSHGVVDRSVMRSREGVRAVLVALGVLGAGALFQTVIFLITGSVALLADLIHNFGDALTAVPLGIAFLMRSQRAERVAGLFVVATIFISACVAGVFAVARLLAPSPPTHLWALAAAGAAGYLANAAAGRVRIRAGRRLDSPALIADGQHARADAIVSLSVVASAIVVAFGVPIADPLIGLVITLAILRITWESWHTVRGADHH
ncbi:MAG: cation diffusion facilitator family transporter [Solirubrobacteraceae bacterium]